MPEECAAAFGDDEIENLYPDSSDWTIEQCRQWLEEHAEIPDDADEYGEDDWRNVVVESDAGPAEVFEWWRITPSLCRELRNLGQVVPDNDYGCWWGRCCTGQQIIMDGTLQHVATLIVDRVSGRRADQ